MDNNQSYIDQLIKEKLQQFQSPPPPTVWAGIEKGLADQPKPIFVLQYARQIAVVVAIFAIAILACWYFIPENLFEGSANIEVENSIIQSETNLVDYPNDNEVNKGAEVETLPDGDEPIENQVTETKTLIPSENDNNKEVASLNPSESFPSTHSPYQVESSRLSSHQIKYLETKNFSFVFIADPLESNSENEADFGLSLYNTKRTALAPELSGETEMPVFKNYWNIGLFLTPEMALKNFDSITLMNTYSLNIEPSWYFSKHWFMRFGAGASLVRDRGFAQVDYMSNDYIGSYDSVYNVTFDTLDAEPYPVYHTKEVEIWDSIRHLHVSEVTNTYYYLQFPLLFGYHNSTDRLKWYFYGGPAINIAIHQQIEDPKSNVEYIEIIQLENNLPIRTDYSMQLWFGAGIDFRIGRKFSLAFEPNYRYYFKPNYQENNYKTALSGLGLRFGLVYKIKE